MYIYKVLIPLNPCPLAL